MLKLNERHPCAEPQQSGHGQKKSKNRQRYRVIVETDSDSESESEPENMASFARPVRPKLMLQRCVIL